MPTSGPRSRKRSSSLSGREDLFRRLAEDPSRLVVVTPNVRLSQALSRDFGRVQAGNGSSVWEAPDILPLGAFIERLYEDALYSDLAPGLPVLLSAAQEQTLWERVVQGSESESPLLSVPSAAALAREAWSVVHRWGLAEKIKTYTGSEDARAFREWASAYERITSREGAVDRARLAELVSSHLAHAALRKPATLVAYGFDILDRQQKAFFAALEARGVELLECAPPVRDSQSRRMAFTSAKDELAAAARWARARLESGSQNIGIVVPDLQRSRSAVVRELHRAMGAGAAPYNVSLGEPLSSYPVVAAAFMLLDLAAGEVPFAIASRVLRSPFIAGGDSELALRARLDAELRRSAGPQVGLEALRRLTDQLTKPDRGAYGVPPCPKLGACLGRLSAQAKTLTGTRDAREWGRAVSDLLDAAGYPGERSLDSREYQALKKWHDVIAGFASLERVVGPMTFAAARARLARIAADTLFQPEAADVPIQVLGVLESAGLGFDHLWVTGLTDESWPLAARPNPFVPVVLQRDAGVPEASPSASLELDRRITKGWLGAAGEVVVSHALREEDRELVASPLIREVPESTLEELGLPPCDTFTDVLRRARREELIDDRAPALASAVSGGGTSLFSDQAACPFRAFARHRLGVREMEQPCPGLDARERGTLVHEMLAKVWTKLKSHALLEAASKADLDAIVAEAVDTAISRVRRYRPDALRGRLARVEKERLTALANDWLALERKRPPFEVVSVEEKHAVTFGGVSVNAKLDRMDRVGSPGGPRHVVLDYKTGQANVGAWVGPRPDEPQLPLYVMGRGGPHVVEGAAFARVRTGEMRFAGIAREEGLVPGVGTVEGQKATRPLGTWDKALASWRIELEALGREFSSGEAGVQPKHGDETCRFCDLKALCRINEKGGG
jgi:ATP-dependent helicase/nuclease subunit B